MLITRAGPGCAPPFAGLARGAPVPRLGIDVGVGVAGPGREADIGGQGLGLARREQAGHEHDQADDDDEPGRHPADVAPADSRAPHDLEQARGRGLRPRRPAPGPRYSHPPP